MKKALAIFAGYYRRLEGAVGKFVAAIKRKHRTSNPERRTSKEDRATPVPDHAAEVETQSQEATVSGWNKEKNEIGDSENSQHPTANIEQPTSNEGPASPAGFAFNAAKSALENRSHLGTATVLVASPKTGEWDARAPRQSHAGEESTPTELRSPNIDLSNVISRDELKRELDSLRRLIESRK